MRMKQVDFYLISNRVNDAKFKLASRLANKLQRLDQRALVITDDTEATAQLDRVMWTFNDTSFLAHDHVTALSNQSSETTVSAKATVHIGEHDKVSSQALESAHDVLINVSSETSVFNHHFSRIAEIVEQDETSKTNARKRYKNYQNEGFEIKTHTIEL